MDENSTFHDSISDSTHSRTSGDALIAKSPQEKAKGLDIAKKIRKHSKSHKNRYDFLESGTAEEQKDNNFKWIPNPPSRHERKSSFYGQHPNDPVISTLGSDKTFSSDTTSDFTYNNNNYGKNGYIRGNNSDKKNCNSCNNSLLKYNEFSSLMSSLGTGSTFPVEVKLEKTDKKDEKRSRIRLEDENSVFLITGGIQMMLGILMAVFGVLVIVHNSSLAGAGSGLWGGAVAMLSGLIGVLAGLKGCYSSDKHETKISPTLLTGFLALCLISFALSNLVLVLTATGLIRDIQRFNYTDQELNENTSLIEESSFNWAPVLADGGLILAAAFQCVIAVMSGYKCYKKVCPCLRRDHDQLSETQSRNDKYKAEGKERLVNNWLGQQLIVPLKDNKKGDGSNKQVPWGAPNIVFLPPPPPVIRNGQVPIWTFLQAPSSAIGSSAYSQMYSGSASQCCCHHDNGCIRDQPLVFDRRTTRRANYIQPDAKVPKKKRSKSNGHKERRRSLPTAEEVARTYTGLDREIAEEFIAISMENGRRRMKKNSLGNYNDFTIMSYS